MTKDKKSKNEKNEGKCRDIKSKLDRINSKIKAYEDKIRYSQKAIRDWDREERQTKAEMKNMMHKYGVSKDFVVGSIIKNPFANISKSAYDESDVPSPQKIENSMNRRSSLKEKIKERDDAIFRIGVDLREAMNERDDLMREWRYSECGRL